LEEERLQSSAYLEELSGIVRNDKNATENADARQVAGVDSS
jgi:hypothetical protein